MANIFTTADRFQAELLRMEREAAREMMYYYGEVWRRLQAEINDLLAAYNRSGGQGTGPEWMMRYSRLKELQRQVEAELQRYQAAALRTISEAQRQAVTMGLDHSEGLVRAQGLVNVVWNRLPSQATNKLIGFLQDGSPLRDLLMKLPKEGTQAAMDELTSGLSLGLNPRQIARNMRQAFGGDLVRSLRVARTEILRSYREAERQSYEANSHIVKGWIWRCAQSERTCAMCWGMDGKEFPTSEKFGTHPNCRCTMIARTDAWDEWVQEHPKAAESGEEKFKRLKPEQQVSILGPAKYAAWKDGKWVLNDLVGVKNDPAWGVGRYEKSLADLIGSGDAKKYISLALMGVAKSAGNYSVDDLVKVAGLGLRELTPVEIDKIVQHVAKVGFDPNGKEKGGGRISGYVWNGKVLKGSDVLPPGEVHYIRHVLQGKEWPGNTTLHDYYQSLREVIENPDSGILINKLHQEWQIGFVGDSAKWQGEKGSKFIFMEYRLSIGSWVTGFQPPDIDKVLYNNDRTHLTWIKKSKLIK